MKLTMNLKKMLLALTCVCTLTFGYAGSVFAMENDLQLSENTNIKKVEEVAEEFQITQEEVQNLEKNFSNAVEQLPKVEAGESIEVPVSENLVLEVETNESELTNARTTYNRTVTSTLRLKNILGETVVTLKSVGVFRTNGKKSTPIDAYGTHSALVWNVSTKKAVKGNAAYNAYVRNSFSGKFNIGISPVNMTVQSFSYSCTIYCNAVGKYSVSWR